MLEAVLSLLLWLDFVGASPTMAVEIGYNLAECVCLLRVLDIDVGAAISSNCNNLDCKETPSPVQ